MDLQVPSISIPGIEQYLEKEINNRNDLFKEIEKIALESNAPIVGPLVGNFLSLICRMTGANNILELGSSIGYSTLWFASALKENGKVVHTDLDSTNTQLAMELARKGDLIDKIEYYTGDALSYLNETNDKFDIIFIDLDKSMYIQALELALPKLKRGGLLIADNTLWGGRIRWDYVDQNTDTIKKYNKLVSSDPNLHTTILPLRDGITISYKKS